MQTADEGQERHFILNAQAQFQVLFVNRFGQPLERKGRPRVLQFNQRREPALAAAQFVGEQGGKCGCGDGRSSKLWDAQEPEPAMVEADATDQFVRKIPFIGQAGPTNVWSQPKCARSKSLSDAPSSLGDCKNSR